MEKQILLKACQKLEEELTILRYCLEHYEDDFTLEALSLFKDSLGVQAVLGYVEIVEKEELQKLTNDLNVAEPSKPKATQPSYVKYNLASK